jgi:hypothetical protein
MKAPSRKILVMGTAVVAVVVMGEGLPTLLTWLANIAIRKMPGIRGKIRGVRIDFLAPGLTVSGISATMLNNGGGDHRIEVSAITLNSQWKKLLTGTIEGSLRIHAPRFLFNVEGIRGSSKGADKGKKQNEKTGKSWQENLTQLPQFRISSVILTDGEIRFVGAPGESDAEVSVDHLNMHAENIINSSEVAPTLMARLSADARLLSSGICQLQAQGYPLARLPTFNADLSSSGIDLEVLRNIILKVAQIDVRHGIAALYVEVSAADGYVSGYANPVFEHLELQTPAHTGLSARLKV